MTDSFADEKGNTVQASYYGMGKDFPLELLITLDFEELDGRTKLTLKHSQLDGLSAKDRDDMKQGWSEILDKLDDYLKKAKSS